MNEFIKTKRDKLRKNRTEITEKEFLDSEKQEKELEQLFSEEHETENPTSQ